MNYSENELIKMKEEILIRACNYAKIHRYENFNVEKIDFEDRRNLGIILRKYRELNEIKDPIQKQLLNQMITNGKNIPSIKIAPYFPIDLSNNEPLNEFFDGIKLKKEEPIQKVEYISNEVIKEAEYIPQKIIEDDFNEEPLFDYTKYYCKICNQNHSFDSDIGNRHYEDNKLEIHLDMTNKRLIEAEESFKRIKNRMRNN